CNDTLTSETSTLSLHDALPIFQGGLEASLAHAQGDHDQPFVMRRVCKRKSSRIVAFLFQGWVQEKKIGVLPGSKFVTRSICVKRERHRVRSEEHTSELQSRFDLVCRLLLEKKKILLVIVTDGKRFSLPHSYLI